MNRRVCCSTVLVLILFLLSSCRGKMTKEQLTKEYASGVVVVRNDYYYKVQLVGGHTFWFVPMPDAMTDIRFYAREDEAKKRMLTTYGTGFFISEEGVLVTNAQVANPMVNSNDVCRALANQLSYLKQYYANELGLFVRRLALVEDGFQTLAKERLEAMAYIHGNLQMRADLDREYIQRKNKLAGMQSGFRQKIDSLKGVLKELEHFNNSQVSIYPVQKLTVACFGEENKGSSAYEPSTLLASNNKTGLAVVQLNKKQTPSSAHVFELPFEGNSFFGLFRKKKPDSHLFVIGLNGNSSRPASIRPYVCPVQVINGAGKTKMTVSGFNGLKWWGAPILDQSGNLVAVSDGDPENMYGTDISQLFQLIKVKYN